VFLGHGHDACTTDPDCGGNETCNVSSGLCELTGGADFRDLSLAYTDPRVKGFELAEVPSIRGIGRDFAAVGDVIGGSPSRGDLAITAYGATVSGTTCTATADCPSQSGCEPG